MYGDSKFELNEECSEEDALSLLNEPEFSYSISIKIKKRYILSN